MTTTGLELHDLLASAMVWTLPPVPYRTGRDVLALVVESLPAVTDDLAADLLDRLGLELVAQEEDRASRRDMLQITLEQLHEAQRTIRRRDALIEELRARVGAERAREAEERTT